MALRIGQTYQFNLVYQGAVSQINYRIDFGDGGQTTWIPGVLNGITTVSHTFTKTGTFTVTVAARSLAIMTVNILLLCFNLFFLLLEKSNDKCSC